MAKPKSIFVCQQCGSKSSKWIGKCPACGEWNTYVEEIEQKTNSRSGVSAFTPDKSVAHRIADIDLAEEKRISTLNNEFNRVLGGGLVPGSLVLIGGEPGIGKSTLLLQVALAMNNIEVLYITGEESLQQIKMRAARLNPDSDNCTILPETQLETIFIHLASIKPNIIIIDSIQTLHTEKIESSPGSISQIRECTNQILQYAKTTAVPVLLIGHITKDGSIAGPKILEHVVDTVLQFEGDQNHMYRILRSVKNRYGSTSELGIYEMQNTGLREVSNPSELLLSNFDVQLSGVAISSAIEGIRPFLIEIQALVSSAAYGTPQRSSTGFDLRRLNMLLAVLEKRAGFRLATKDVFLNIAGGIKVNDPAIDLSVICAILSSNQDVLIGKDVCFSGEVGLAGEIRPVNRIEQRIKEAEKLGFSYIVISEYNKKGIDFTKYKIKIVFVKKVGDILKKFF
ncbi:MAG: DNA repair protein RadA [Chlorobi bacterium]|nr:DNA repair protein RadA [Chlorobiota bacterium]